jgi:integrase
MVLAMARPQKHPKTGIYWFRMRVPKDLRRYVPKTEITKTLGTRDPVEAAAQHRRVAAEIAAQWAGFRRGEQSLTHKQRVAIAGEMYREMVEAGQAEPGSVKEREAALEADRSAISRGVQTGHTIGDRNRALGFFVKFGPRLDEFLERKGIMLSSKERAALLTVFAGAVDQANEQLLKNAKGDYSPDPKAARFPEYVAPEKESAASKSLVTLYDLYVGQLHHSAGTIKRWRPKFAQFEEFIAPKAWHQATKQDVIGWLDELLKPTKFPDREPIKPITVRDVHFASLRALYGFLEQRDWGKNPFAGVRVRMPKYEEQTRDKDLTEDEAKIILRAALKPPNARMAPEYQAAFKWVPWILAYTGARVNEITQMRKQDIKKVDGVPVFNITPEAGNNKTKRARLVPIHPHLVEMGLLKFVDGAGQGPLFCSAARTRGGKESKTPYKKTGERLAAWVRKLGVADDGVMPNHGWRHRLSSILIGMRVQQRVIDAILGHKKGQYGVVRLDLKKDVVDRIPWIALDGADSTVPGIRTAEPAEPVLEEAD